MTVLCLKFLAFAYICVGLYSCWWGVKATRQMNITDDDTLMLLAILSLASITLWPLFFIMEGVKWDNPFTRQMGTFMTSCVNAYKAFKESRAQA
jgi:hypothetical protein